MKNNAIIQPEAFFKFSYGLFVLSSVDPSDRHNGCIINTAQQITTSPNQVSIAVNKDNHTHDLIFSSKIFNVSVLSEKATFDVIQRFGFASGRDQDKFAGFDGAEQVGRSENGLLYIKQGTNAFFSAKVVQTVDCGTHTIFIGEVTEAAVLDDAPSATYAYYFSHIKPKPAAVPAAEASDSKAGEEPKVQWVCKICGYVYEGDPIPDDFICPLCKHGAQDFERVEG